MQHSHFFTNCSLANAGYLSGGVGVSFASGSESKYFTNCCFRYGATGQALRIVPLGTSRRAFRPTAGTDTSRSPTPTHDPPVVTHRSHGTGFAPWSAPRESLARIGHRMGHGMPARRVYPGSRSPVNRPESTGSAQTTFPRSTLTKYWAIQVFPALDGPCSTVGSVGSRSMMAFSNPRGANY